MLHVNPCLTVTYRPYLADTGAILVKRNCVRRDSNALDTAAIGNRNDIITDREFATDVNWNLTGKCDSIDISASGFITTIERFDPLRKSVVGFFFVLFRAFRRTLIDTNLSRISRFDDKSNRLRP